MSRTFQHLVIRTEPGKLAGRYPLRPVGRTSDDWVMWGARAQMTVASFDALVQDVASTISSPALGAHVETSDYGYVVAVSKATEARLVINERTAVHFNEGKWALRKVTGQSPSDDWKNVASDHIAVWSKAAPKTLRPEDVLSILSQNWTFAEDGVEALLLALGLPTPPPGGPGTQFEGAFRTWDSGVYREIGLEIDCARSRYVLGESDDYFGIWDRERPGPPIRRFLKNGSAESAAKRQWIEMAIRTGAGHRRWWRPPLKARSQ